MWMVQMIQQCIQFSYQEGAEHSENVPPANHSQGNRVASMAPAANSRAAESTNFKRLRLRLRADNIDSGSSLTRSFHPKKSNMM